MSLLQHRQRDRFLQTGIHDRDHLASFVFGQSLRELVPKVVPGGRFPEAQHAFKKLGLLLNQRAEIRIESPGQGVTCRLIRPRTPARS